MYRFMAGYNVFCGKPKEKYFLQKPRGNDEHRHSEPLMRPVLATLWSDGRAFVGGPKNRKMKVSLMRNGQKMKHLFTLVQV